jgi:hypothetical protein
MDDGLIGHAAKLLEVLQSSPLAAGVEVLDERPAAACRRVDGLDILMNGLDRGDDLRDDLILVLFRIIVDRIEFG